MAGDAVRGQVMGRVNGIVTAQVGPVFSGRGVSGISRNGAGDYVLTYATECQLEPTTTQFVICVRGNVGQSLAPRWTATDTTLRVLTFDETGAAADRDFSVYTIEQPPAAE